MAAIVTAYYVAEVHAQTALGDQWLPRALIPAAVNVYGLATVNGRIYAFCINDKEAPVTYAYDPQADAWTAKAPMPTSRRWFGTAALDGKVYAIGGTASYDPSNGTVMSAANEAYDPATDTWTSKAAMPTARSQIGAQTVNGKIIITCGLTASYVAPTVTNATEIYDATTDTWGTGAAIPIRVFGYASAALNGKIYYFGGSLSGAPYFESIIQVYDAAADSWGSGAPMPTLTIQAVAAATTGSNTPEGLYLIGGRMTNPIAASQIYDPATDKWTSGTPFPTTHDYVTEYLAATTLNDTVFVVGGIAHANEGSYGIAELYVPADYNGTIPMPVPATTAPSLSPTPAPTSSPTPASTATPTPTPTPSATVTPTSTPTISQPPTPVPSVPELPWWVTTLLFFAALGLVAIFGKGQRH